MKKLIVGLCMLLVLSVGCSKSVSGSAGRDIGSNYVAIDISANDNCVRTGETVKLRATATNRGRTVAMIQLNDKPVLDIQIRYFDQTKSPPVEYFQTWSEGRVMSTDLTELELKSGESKTIEMEWVALALGGSLPAVDVNGLLRYGESEDEVATAHTVFSVDRCP